MISAAAHDAGTKPLKIGAGSGSVRLALDVPGAVGSEKFAEIFAGPSADARATMRRFVRPHQHLEIFFGMNLRPGFEQGAAEAAFGEDFGGRAAARAGADDADVVLLGGPLNLRHEGCSAEFLFS